MKIMNQLDENKRRKINQKIIDAASSRFVPPRTSFSPEEAKTLFYPPITLNTKEPEKAESRFTNDAAIGSSFNAYYASLTQHALDLGQFPMTSFVGYGVLQNIAQNGMIRTCIQTVADDMCREWIQVEGGEDESADNVKKLQDLQENKYRLRKLFNEALSIVGFMGGCFIFVDTGVEGEALKLPLNYSDKSAELVAIEHCITAEQYTFIFQIITAASFGMSRCMDHLNGKSRQSDNIQILQKYIRHNRTSLSIMYSHIDRRFAEHLLFLMTGINRNIIFLLYCLCSQNVVKMSMGKKNRHRFSIHPGNLHFNLLRTICGINNDQFSGFFILKEIAICIYRS